MDKTMTWKEKWQAFVSVDENKLSGFWLAMARICRWMYRLRAIVLSIPVAITAICLAIRNSSVLPEMVGVDLQASGEFAKMIERSTAVWIPLGITGICILLTCISRRFVFPWLIAVFSLVLPYVIELTNTFA